MLLKKIVTGMFVSAACSVAFAGQQGGDHMDTTNMPKNYDYKAKGENHKYDHSKVRKAQKALNERGYDVDVDGVLGTGTSNALHDFQLEQGLAPTHRLNQETLAALGIENSNQRNNWMAGQENQRQRDRNQATRRPASVQYDAYYIFDSDQGGGSAREQALKNSPMKMYTRSTIQEGHGIPQSALEPGMNRMFNKKKRSR